jgi:hypothetical protein
MTRYSNDLSLVNQGCSNPYADVLRYVGGEADAGERLPVGVEPHGGAHAHGGARDTHGGARDGSHNGATAGPGALRCKGRAGKAGLHCTAQRRKRTLKTNMNMEEGEESKRETRAHEAGKSEDSFGICMKGKGG